MKKSLMIIAAALCLAATSNAQETFYPGFRWSVKGGAAYTIGETNDMSKLISPSVAMDFGWQFSPLFSLRADVSGWEGKAYNIAGGMPQNWKMQYLQLAVDAKFDIISMFEKQYRHHIANPYLLIGVGGQYRFNHTATAAMLPADNFLNSWEKFSYVGRLGAGIDFRVCKEISILLEYVENATDDTFNLKKGDLFDHQMTLQLGVLFTLDQASKARHAAQMAAAAQASASDVAASRAAAAEAAKKAAEAAAAAEAATQKLAEIMAAQQNVAPAPVVVVDPKAPVVSAGAAGTKVEDNDIDAASGAEGNCVYFLIGKSDFNEEDVEKINAVIKVLKADSGRKVYVRGYADKETGSKDYNWKLSEKRAKNVSKAIVDGGIDASRVISEWFGDTRTLSSEASLNRVAVMVIR